MNGIKFSLRAGNGFFKKPETNHNPCTFSFMHKVAMVGLVGATTGIERREMAPLFPQLCEDLLYSIKILAPVVKEPHGFTKRDAVYENFGGKGRRGCEILRNPSYEIVIGLKNERSRGIFDKFRSMIENRKRVYPQVVGNLNCPAYCKHINNPEISEERVGEFETDSVISAQHKILGDIESVDMSFEWSPIVENEWKHTKNAHTVYTNGQSIKVHGPYRMVMEEARWFM